MEKHVILVGALHIGYSAFQILGGLIAFLFIVGGGLLGGLISEEEFVIGITFFIATTIALAPQPPCSSGVRPLAARREAPLGNHRSLCRCLWAVPFATGWPCREMWQSRSRTVMIASYLAARQGEDGRGENTGSAG